MNVTREKLEDVMKELEMTEGFDVCLEMSGAPSCLKDIIDNSRNGANISAGHPAGRLQHRMEQVYLEGAEDEGHLWP